MKLFANIISEVFQPLLMPILAIYLVFGVHAYYQLMYGYIPGFVNRIYLITIVLTVILPLLSFFTMYKWGFISDLKMSVRKERILPTYISLVYYGCFYYLIREITGLDEGIICGVFGAILAVFIANIITLFWKISIHGVGISLVAGMFLGTTEIRHVDHTYMVILLFILIGLVGFSRLYLNRHTPAQVLAGSLLGFFVTYCCILWGVSI